MTPTQSQALQQQITDLGARMDRGFDELKEIMVGFETRVRGLEQREAGCQPLLQSRVDAAFRLIDEHSSEIKKLNEIITELRQTNRIITWLGGLVGSAIILWIIGQMLGLIK